MNTAINDPVKLRGLSSEMQQAAKQWRQQIEELTKAHAKLLQRCKDQRIDEFTMDFKKTVKAVQEIEQLLTSTSKHLELKATEFEHVQKI